MAHMGMMPDAVMGASRSWRRGSNKDNRTYNERCELQRPTQ